MYTVAIPAYNEAREIDQLLKVICAAVPESVTEILVCDNASTDDTAQVVRRWRQQLPLVRLVTAEQPGKPSAWNRIYQEAQTEFIVFLDADVSPDVNFLERMIASTTRTKHIMYSGRRRFALPHHQLKRRLIGILADPVIELCVAGPCYAVRRVELGQRIAQRGYAEMPDVFAEDIWLQCCLEQEDLVILDDCVVDVPIDSLDYYLLLQARKRLVDYELSTSFPDMAFRLDSNFPQALQPLAQVLAVTTGYFDASRKLRWMFGAACKAGVNTLYRQRIRQQARELMSLYDRYGGSEVLRSLARSSAQ